MLMIPRRTYIDKFGNGKYKTKIGIALTGTVLVALGSAFRAGGAWLPTAFLTEPTKWYFSRTCFYVFDYGLEVIVLYMYLIARIDKRFYVPDGSQGAGAYSGDVVAEPPTRSWDYEAYLKYHENAFDSDGVTLGEDGRTTRGSERTPSYLEMDQRSGKWNVREMSHVTLSSTLHGMCSALTSFMSFANSFLKRLPKRASIHAVRITERHASSCLRISSMFALMEMFFVYDFMNTAGDVFMTFLSIDFVIPISLVIYNVSTYARSPVAYEFHIFQ